MNRPAGHLPTNMNRPTIMGMTYAIIFCWPVLLRAVCHETTNWLPM